MRILRRAILLWTISLLPVSAARAQRAPGPLQSCGEFVQHFYVWYHSTEKFRTTKGLTAEEIVLDKRAALLTDELHKALSADRSAERKSPGEIVGLDFDPYFGVQDLPVKFEIKVTLDDQRCNASVYEYWDRKKGANPDVVAELVPTGTTWQFANFHYVHNGKPTNVLKILNELKADRDKDPSVKK